MLTLTPKYIFGAKVMGTTYAPFLNEDVRVEMLNLASHHSIRLGRAGSNVEVGQSPQY
jgi:hypothetical protein